MIEIANWNGYELDQCYAYSDSASDLPMLEAVGHPVAVNPDAKLERHARRNGWPIVIFSQQTKSVVRRTATSIGAVGIAGASFAAGVALSSARSGTSRPRDEHPPECPGLAHRTSVSPIARASCPSHGSRRSGRGTGNEGELAALGDEHAGGVPDLAVLVEQTVVDEP